MIKKIGFIGLGLIGGSLAKAIKNSNPSPYIVAYDINSDSLRMAKESHTIDDYTLKLDDNFSDCDIIFLCAPVKYNIEALKQLLPILNSNCIVTDVGSTKLDIMSEVKRLEFNNFIGGHPMTGSEKTNYESSSSHLFENAYYILTPMESTQSDMLHTLQQIILSIGALPVIVDSKEHDYITATISHVPHIIASALVNVVKELDNEDGYMHTLAAGGFKDITRIASSSPTMWQQICLTNKDQILDVIISFQDALDKIKNHISSKNNEEIYNFFLTARDYRDSFSNKKLGPIVKYYEIVVDVVDKPGIIAEIATLLSNNSISIKNIGIINNRESEQGVLEIIFYDALSQQKSIELLTKMNYKVYKR